MDGRRLVEAIWVLFGLRFYFRFSLIAPESALDSVSPASVYGRLGAMTSRGRGQLSGLAPRRAVAGQGGGFR